MASKRNLPEARGPAPLRRETLVAGVDHAGLRLDRFLSDRLSDLTRARVQALIRGGHVVAAGGTICEPSRRVKLGDVFALTVPAPDVAEPAGEDIGLSVVFEDAHVIVIEKPAGLVVHPGAGHASGTLVNALIAHCGASLSGIGGVRRPGIVHRLDKGTSGLLVVAKTDAAHHGLSAQFASHGSDGKLHRAYVALVWGVPQRASGLIDARLSRSATKRTKMAVVRGEAGRRAVTHYKVLETFSGASGKPVASLLRLELETGRTHQIRVHLAHIGHPIVGDPVYAAGFKASASLLSVPAQDALSALGRQALHAAELGFEHPASGRKLSFVSALPDDVAKLVKALRSHVKKGPRR